MPDEHKGGSRPKSEFAHSQIEQLTSLLVRGKRRPLKLTEDHMASLILLRRARGALFGEGLFSDPAWDILLELYAAHLGARGMSLTELAQAIETPQSTTARWITALDDRGLVSTKIDPNNPARVQVQLTPDGVSKMEHLGNHWGSAFVSI